MSLITIASEFGEITIVDEPTYAFGSADSGRRYVLEKNLQSNERPTSVHGVLLDGEPRAVFGAAGGCSAVHEHSALVLDSKLLLAVEDCLACFDLHDQELFWSAVVDSATCFGVHYEPQRNAIISHGELDTARINGDGSVLWTSSGADVFSEGFCLEKEYIAVVDFNHREYHISYETGDHI